jgi:hypothetical protein
MGGTRTSILEILRNANSSVSVLRSSRPAHHRKTSQIATPRHWQLCWRRDSCEPATKIGLTINLKTAKTLGLEVPAQRCSPSPTT